MATATPSTPRRIQVPPNCDLTLGLVCIDKSTPGTTVWQMRASERFANPAGATQGGFLAALAETPFALEAVHNDRHSYYLTCKAWAENLERVRGEVIRRWGERLYRTFRLYLWGSAHAFLSDRLQAYRLVLERPLAAREEGSP